MRELKFRAWDTVSKHYVPENEVVLVNPYNFESYGNKYIWEQYTGLKDKNGKEIYEGDIVLVAHHGLTPYVVTYREWDCTFACKNENLVDFVHMFKTMPQCYKVIGNIHENPELLEREDGER